MDAPVFDSFADALKSATWSMHKRAERSGVVRKLLTNTASLDEYLLYQKNLLHVYEGLEQARSHRQLAGRFGHFIGPYVSRATRLRSDLNASGLAPGATVDELPLLGSAIKYRQHIDEAPPAALLGHCYVRYLGDLNGGQVLKRLIKKQFKLSDDELTFYDFDAVPNVSRYREDYRQRFDDLELAPGERQTGIAAAVKSFEWNIRLSEEVVQCAAATRANLNR